MHLLYLLISFILIFLIIGFSRGVGVYLKVLGERDSLTEEIKRRKPEIKTIENLQKKRDSLIKEMSELEKIKSEELSKIELLKELTRLLPETAWIWNLKYNGKEIEISGFADSASELISILDKSPLFEKVEFMAPVMKERQFRQEGFQEKERFKIKAKIEKRR